MDEFPSSSFHQLPSRFLSTPLGQHLTRYLALHPGRQNDIILAMKAQLEPQDIDAIAQRVVELLKPYLLVTV